MATGGAVDGLVGRCAELEALRQRISRIARSELRVHVFGETGTGKECVARALHDLSPRSRRLFVPVNVAGFSDELFVSELFGHARGAFTGATAAREGYVAQAEGGTLFIDEVAEMSPLAQVRLLRFLQEREYQRLGETAPRRADVRVISATNFDLAQAVHERRFRQDLYFRLVEERVVVPPLRERGEDVLLLARHFLRAFSEPLGRPQPVLGREAEALLRRYPWPGNVRELESQMRRLVVLAPGREVRGCDLGPEIAGAVTAATPAGGLHEAMRCIESEILRRTLERHGGVQARAAAELGITRQALCAKLRRLRGLVGTA
ncbi:MAG TPA: sigma-54 dependent transcriptional regulator [Vicinamibacteria bacterium]|nr:sigma-54 dependent transcriptional regulator [Vicinamibacteria bacterium]